MTCAICLDTWVHPVKLDGCFHTYCWTCALEWAKKSMTCPYCKKNFVSLIHSIHPETMAYERVFLESPAMIEYYSRMEAPPTSNKDTKRKVVYTNSLEPVITWTERPLPFPRQKNEPNSQIARRKVSIDKITKWLERELDMLIQAPGVTREEIESEIELVTTLVITLLERGGSDALKSEEGREKLYPFLSNKVEKFTSELLCFLASPYTTPQQYDSNTKYTSGDSRVWFFGKTPPPAISADVIDLTADTKSVPKAGPSDSFILIDEDSDEMEIFERKDPDDHSDFDSEFDSKYDSEFESDSDSYQYRKKSKAEAVTIIL
eukprot:TRINITY_DN7282_c0_g1_i1.p1 TRINITY_DN7282_c0_g1~~TRINITY_DN7282_c0_g1_i1.p1  ORF type:complete len:319 (+),score=42.79 TRINITY_DN7282_c0_g1_i1:47-1003(+)